MTKIKYFLSLIFIVSVSFVSYGQFQTQPSNISVCEGGSITESVIYQDVNGAPTANWTVGSTTQSATVTLLFSNFYNIELSVGSSTSAMGGDLIANVTPFAGGSATSNTATVTVNSLPSLTAINNVTTCVGQDAAFTSTASGGATPYNYTWTRYTGATTDNYSMTSDGTLSNVTSGMNNSNIGLVISDANGCMASTVAADATLNVSEAPTITSNPVAAAYCNSSNVTLSVAANNASTYQWVGSTTGTIGGATSASYVASTAEDFTVIVGNTGCTNGAGAVTSTSATVTESPTLAITTQPTDGTVVPNGNQNFTVIVTAGENRSVIWTLDGETLTDGVNTAAGTGVSIAAEVDNGSNSYSYTISLTSVAAADVSKSIMATITDACGTVASNTAALPVDLVSFTGNQVKDQIELAWETASELNNDYFVIERSVDGGDFVELGQVVGAGTTTEYSYYQYVDQAPLNGVNYYRLKQVDFDGQFEYSDIIVIEVKGIKASSISINPTASRNHITINMDTPFENDMMITVTNSVGQVVLQDNILAGQNLLDIDISNLNAGQFNITFSNKSQIFTHRFIKL